MHDSPYKILKWVGEVVYVLKLQCELAPVHLVFLVSIIKKRIRDSVSILPM